MMLLDDFVKDKEVLAKLAKDDLWTGESVPLRGWYDGWAKSSPSNVWEELIHEIWKYWPNVAEAKGFEWWTNIHHKSSSLGWHQDKDEDAAEGDRGNIICPNYGAIFYPYPHKCDGGMLEVMHQNDEDTIERLAPVHNRLIMFDPSQFHRVSRVYTGERRAFIVNLWKDHVPKL